MVGYTEVLQVMAAMIIFSIILMTSNRMIYRNTIIQVEGELEQETIAVAQDVIEEARTKEFDEENVENSLPPVHIPGDFAPSDSLGPDDSSEASSRTNFDDFDDYNGWSGVVNTEHGDFTIRAEVTYADPNSTPEPYQSTSSKTTFKKMRIFIENAFLTKNMSDSLTTYTFEFIRNYYGD